MSRRKSVSIRQNQKPARLPRWLLPAVILFSIALGLACTFRGTFGWDEMAMEYHGRWLLSLYHLLPHMERYPEATVNYYGTIWDLLLAFTAEFPLKFLHDPFWLRMALNAALYPVTLFLAWALLRRAGTGTWTAALSTAVLFSIIRFGGHALINTRDFPAASAYLLVTIGLWILLRDVHAAAAKGRLSVWRLAVSGAVSVLPFLVRPPLIPLYAGLILFLCFYAVDIRSKLTRKQKILLVLVPLLSGLAMLAVFYPPFWTVHPREWMEPFTLFSRYPHDGPIRVMGVDMTASTTPWWYALSWILVIIHPLGLLACLGGIVLAPFAKGTCSLDFPVVAAGRKTDLSLQRWLWLVTAATWASVLLVHPVVYDEERHLLFLYPLLFVTASLGLHGLERRWKIILSIALVFAAGVTYIQWNTYAYVFKSVLAGNISASRYTGDYWGVCINDAVRALKDVAPPGPFTVAVNSVADAQLSRLKGGTLSRLPGYEPYSIGTAAPGKPQVSIVLNRLGMQNFEADRREGRANLLWVEMLPSGDAACMILLYPHP